MNRFKHNNNNNNIYECNYTNDIQSAKNNYYKEQKNKSIDPTNKNIIAPYARNLINSVSLSKNLKYNNDIMGPVVDNTYSEKNSNKSFNEQFDLAKIVTNKPVAKNELYTDNYTSEYTVFNPKIDDMTYGVVTKEDFTFTNMVPFTKQRDRIINDQNSFVSRSLATFTGVGVKEHKKEVETFFNPEERIVKGKNIVYGDDDVRERIKDYSSISKNGEKPFEPEQVGPGVGLDYTVQGLGGMHDTTRILPYTIDDLRAKNKQQVTYTLPVIAGQMGHNASTVDHIGEVRKYRPDKFKEYSIDELRAGKAVGYKQTAPQNITIKNGNRMVSRELQGPINKSDYNKFNPNSSGKIKDSTRQQYDDLPIGVIGSSAYNKNGQTNDSSYINYENQRDTTNYEHYSNIGSSASNGYNSQFIDEAKPTIKQTTIDNDYIGPISADHGYYSGMHDDAKATGRQNIMANIDFYVKGQGGYYNTLNDVAKETIRMETNQPFQQMVQTQGGQVRNALTDEAKSTIRMETNKPFQQMIQTQGGQVRNQWLDEAKSTIRMETNKPFQQMVQTSGGQVRNQLLDEAKSTIRMETNQPFNTMVQMPGGQVRNQLLDEAKSTIRMETNQPFNNIVQMPGGQVRNAWTDEAKVTTRMETNKPFQQIVQTQGGQVRNQWQDEAKSTIRMETNKPFQQMVQTPVGQVISNLQDEARSTIKQSTIVNNYHGSIHNSSNMGQTVYLTDEAKPTIKQSTMTYDYNGIVNSNVGPAVYLTDEAKPTIKQSTMTYDYNGNVNSNIGPTVYLTDEAKPTIKQSTMTYNYNGGANSNVGQVVYLTDEAKSTIKQSTMIYDYNSGANSNVGQAVYLTDEAKPTIKQSTMILDYIHIPNSSSIQKLKAQQLDEAKPTIKQDTMLYDFMGNIKNTGPDAQRSRLDTNNMEIHSLREEIAKERAPTWRGISLTPDSKLLNVELKNNPTYNPLFIPNKSNTCTERPVQEYLYKKNILQQENAIFDADFLDIMGDTLKQNSLVNNLIHKGNSKLPVNSMFNYVQS